MRNFFTKLLMLYTLWAHSQTLESFKEINIPTPKNAQFNNYVDVPVSFNTGRAAVSVPIFLINSGDIQVPIALQYNSGGVKVSDISSRVGLGWRLDVGGMISRVQRMKSDEKGYLKEDFSNAINNCLDGDNSLVKNINERFISDFNKGVILDVVPDIFNFSLPGYSGKFFIDQKTKKVVLQSFSDLKVEVFGIDTERITSFVITDSKGVKFYLGVSEDKQRTAHDSMKNTRYTKHSEKDGVSDAGSNSRDDSFQNWMLLDVVDTKVNRVSFDYGVDKVEYVERIKDRPYFITELDGNGITGEIDYYTLKGQTVIDELYLKEITFNDKDKILFKMSSEDRSDIIRGKALEKIEVLVKGSLLKGFNLKQTYKDAFLDYTSNINPIYTGKGQKRMFLTSVNEYSKQGDKPSYHFFYNENKLPNRFSNSVDSWGYYNGAQNGKYLPYVLSRKVNASSLNYGRYVNFESSKSGILERIKYPTGGEAILNYESNLVKVPNFMSEILSGYTNNVEYKDIFFYEDKKYEQAEGVYESEIFTIEENNLSKETKYQIEVRNEGCGIEVREVGCKFDIALYKLSNDNTETLYANYFLEYIDKIGFIEPGRYKFKATRIAEKESPFSEFNLTFTYGVEQVKEGDEMLIGGLRIKEIILKDENKEVSKTTYSYLTENNKSSGRLFSFPYFRTANSDLKFSGVSERYFVLDNLYFSPQ